MIAPTHPRVADHFAADFEAARPSARTRNPLADPAVLPDLRGAARERERARIERLCAAVDRLHARERRLGLRPEPADEMPDEMPDYGQCARSGCRNRLPTARQRFCCRACGAQANAGERLKAAHAARRGTEGARS